MMRKRFDFHVHCFPDALAPRAMDVLRSSAAPFGITSHTDGTADGASAILAEAGIGAAHVCNIATNARQEKKVNDFALSLAGSDKPLFAAGSIHPDSGVKGSELDRLLGGGIRGIKIHPDYVGVMITDPRYDEIFSLCEERGMYVVTHAGFDPVSPSKIHATADGLLSVIRAHPKLTLVAAHMGGPAQLAEVREKLTGTGIYFDTSLSSTRPDEREELIALIREHGPDRFLFGTDTPWSVPSEEVAFLETSGLPDGALEMIFYKNAARLLNLN